MDRHQLKAALILAQSKTDLTPHDERIFDGCLLHGFSAVMVTIPQVAKLLRSNVVEFGGGIDSNELANIASVGRHKFIIVGTWPIPQTPTPSQNYVQHSSRQF